MIFAPAEFVSSQKSYTELAANDISTLRFIITRKMRFNVYRMPLILAIIHGQGIKQTKAKPSYSSFFQLEDRM